MNDLQIFNYGEVPVRTIVKDGEPWWVAKDVCEVFGETNRNRAMQALDADEKGYTQIDTPGGQQKMAIINEPGLYKLLFIMQPEKARGVSNEYIAKRQAQLKKFTRWVTHEVLPAIHKTGSYSVSPYKPKASSVGEVIKLVEMTRSMMEEQGCSPNDIAQAVKQLCDQFNINLPDFFVKPKDLTLEDAMDTIDFVYAHERGRGKRKPTYEEFIEVQIAVKRLEY
jgi:prophage antirepressor-like protein